MAEIFRRQHRWYSVRVFSTTSAVDVDRAFQYAKKWKYDAVEFDLARDVTPTRDLVVRSALAAASLGEWNGPLMFRVAASEANEFLVKDKESLAYWNIVFHLPMEEPLARAQTGGFKPNPMRTITYRLLPGTDLGRLKIAVSALRDVGHESVHLEFPFQSPRARQPWREPQIRSWVETLRREFPEVEMKAPLGWGMDDPNMPSDEAMFPDPVVVRDTGEKGEPRVSVVIPTFEKTIELMNTLRHLFRQRLPRAQYEIIIVDCGSHDTTVKDVEKLMDGDGRGVSMTLVQIPRTVRRKLGDNRYRAGLARNVGASLARAPILAFLDDDMLVPKDYLEVVVRELDKSMKYPKVLMGRRYDLRDDVFGVRMAWEKINPQTDIRFSDRGFWRDFLSQADRWMELDYPWRFMLSHSISMRTEFFKRTGWFRENFTSYGYEDLELGWRFVKEGATLQLLSLDLYHQSRGDYSTEFGGNHRDKLRLLGRSARVFFRHNLSPEVYVRTRYLFRRPIQLWLIWDQIATGGPFWRWKRRNFTLPVPVPALADGSTEDGTNESNQKDEDSEREGDR